MCFVIEEYFKKLEQNKGGIHMKGRFLSVLLTGALLSTTLAGCSLSSNTPKDTSNNKDTSKKVEASTGKTEEKYKDFITVDVFNSQANYQGIQSGWFGEVVKEKFNMELNIIAPNVAGGGDTLFQTRSAAGDLGDLIITGAQDGRLQKLVTAELVMDMSELIKDKENLMSYDASIQNLQDLVEEDGIWAIPSDVSGLPANTPSEGLDLTFGPYFKWDTYKAVGYPEMNTLEDMLPVLKKMQDAQPTSDSGNKTYAFSLFKDWDGNLMNLAKQPTCFYGYDEIGFVLAKADGSDYQSIIDDDSMYVRVLKLFYEANQMGLVDPESTTQNYDMLFTKYVNGQVLFSPWPWLGQSAYNTTEHKAEGKGFMIAPINDMKIFSYGCNPQGNAKNTIAIGTKAEDPERLMDFIEWLYSPEGIEMSAQHTAGTCGPEGLTWEMKDGQPVLTEFGKEALLNGDAQMPEEWGGGSWKEGTSQLNFKAVSLVDVNPQTGFHYSYRLWDSVLELNKTPLDEDWQNHMGATTTLEYLEKNNQYMVAPGSGYVQPEESSEVATLRGQCRAIIVENSWKMIFATNEQEFNSLLKTMQDTVNGLGYEKVLAVDMDNAKAQNEARLEAMKH